jgi:hypothetical protein
VEERATLRLRSPWEIGIGEGTTVDGGWLARSGQERISCYSSTGKRFKLAHPETGLVSTHNILRSLPSGSCIHRSIDLLSKNTSFLIAFQAWRRGPFLRS